MALGRKRQKNEPAFSTSSVETRLQKRKRLLSKKAPNLDITPPMEQQSQEEKPIAKESADEGAPANENSPNEAAESENPEGTNQDEAHAPISASADQQQ